MEEAATTRIMREQKMAELLFEAPLAKFDRDEWNDFHDFQGAADLDGRARDTGNAGSGNINLNLNESNGNSLADNFTETFSGSLEDLVNTFDEKITKCFCNYDEQVGNIAPVQIRTQEEIMSDCQLWWTITGNFGNILPIDWSKTYARQLQEKSLKLGDEMDQQQTDLDLSDDEEIAAAFDIHSLVISSLQQEPLFTAEEVITEIEDMMGDSPPVESESELMFGKLAELQQVQGNRPLSSSNLEESLKGLSATNLNDFYEDLECTIKEYSEILIQQLALRDELEYEKELKNQFISLLLTVQKKRRDPTTPTLGVNRRSNNHKKTQSNEHGTYLTTVIPYHANQGLPSIEQLQIYIKILNAINDDSPAVPGLLTDYILKVLCPTS